MVITTSVSNGVLNGVPNDFPNSVSYVVQNGVQNCVPSGVPNCVLNGVRNNNIILFLIEFQFASLIESFIASPIAFLTAFLFAFLTEYWLTEQNVNYVYINLMLHNTLLYVFCKADMYLFQSTSIYYIHDNLKAKTNLHDFIENEHNLHLCCINIKIHFQTRICLWIWVLKADWLTVAFILCISHTFTQHCIQNQYALSRHNKVFASLYTRPF